MYRQLVCAGVFLALGAKEVTAEGISGTLSELVNRADRVVIGEVGKIESVIETQTVTIRNGQPILGKFLFTYVDLAVTEHLIGDHSEKVKVRLVGGIHPDGAKYRSPQ